jgi:hypothetical protein
MQPADVPLWLRSPAGVGKTAREDGLDESAP